MNSKVMRQVIIELKFRTLRNSLIGPSLICWSSFISTITQVRSSLGHGSTSALRNPLIISCPYRAEFSAGWLWPVLLLYNLSNTIHQQLIVNKAALQYNTLIKQLTGLLALMLHNTRCVSVIDHINEKRLSFLCTHNTGQCITIGARSTIEFHSPLRGLLYPQPEAA